MEVVAVSRMAYPVMGVAERDAAATVLRAVLDRRLLVEHDADLVTGACEALTTAPLRDGELPVQHFDGKTFDAARDGKRLTNQFAKVRRVMLDGRWHTLAEVERLCGDGSASVSARIRDLRKAKFGGYTVQRKSVGGGVHAYRVLPPGTPQDHPHEQPAPSAAAQQVLA